MMRTTCKQLAGLASIIISVSLPAGGGISHAAEPVSVPPERAAASTDLVDEPFSLSSQTYKTRTLFTTACINRNAGRCKIDVYKGNVYAIYARLGDERMMVAKIPFDGSAAVIQPLVGGTDPKVRGYKASSNNHKRWIIAADRAGYIHVSGDMHTRDDMGYWRSNKPEDVSSFTQIEWEDKALGTPLRCPISEHTTFPHFNKGRTGQLFYGAYQSAYVVPLCSYDETTKLWTSLGGRKTKKGEEIISLAWREGISYTRPTDKGGFGGTSFTPVWDSNNRLHMVIGILDKDTYGKHPPAVGTSILYVYSDDGGKTVHRADGTPVQYPIRASSGPEANRGDIILEEMKDPKFNWLNRHAGLSLDKADRPTIAVESYTTGMHYFRLENGHWVDHRESGSNSCDPVDPSGVRLTDSDTGKEFKRFWNPNSRNMATIPTPGAVDCFDKDYYRNTGELVWLTVKGSGTDATFTIYRTVFDRVSKVIGVDFEPATKSQGRKSGDIANGFCFYTGLSKGTWNTVTGPIDTRSTSATSEALVPMDGSATMNPVKVTLGGGGGESFSFGTWTTVPDALRGDGIQLDATTGASVSITVSGLIPGNRYDLVLFGSDSANPANVTFNGVTRVTDGVFKEVTADANGNIRGSVACKGTIARLAGLQIQGIFRKLITP